MLTSLPASSSEALHARVDLAHSLDVAQQLVGRDVVAKPVGGGVVGDRQVLIAALPGGASHLGDGVAPVGGHGVAVQVAAQVILARRARAARRRRRRRPRARRAPRAARAVCRRGPAARRPPPRSRSAAVWPVASSSTPYSETCRPLRTAASRRARLCSLEPVECWRRFPNWSGATTLELDGEARVGDGAGARLADRPDGLDELEVGQRRGEGEGLVRWWRPRRGP